MLQHLFFTDFRNRIIRLEGNSYDCSSMPCMYVLYCFFHNMTYFTQIYLQQFVCYRIFFTIFLWLRPDWICLLLFRLMAFHVWNGVILDDPDQKNLNLSLVCLEVTVNNSLSFCVLNYENATDLWILV